MSLAPDVFGSDSDIMRGVVGLIVLVACGGSASQEGTPDARIGAPDAAAIDSALWDGPVADSGGTIIDALLADATPTTWLTVRVNVGGVPAPGVTVMAHAADGAYLTMATTDATGTVKFGDMPSGGMITAVARHSGRAVTTEGFLYTVAGLDPNATVIVGPAVPPPSATLDISWPNAGTDVGYTAYDGCSWSYYPPGTLSGSRTLNGACVATPASTADVLVMSLDLITRERQYATATAISLSPGGGGTDLSGSTVISAWRTDFATMQVDLVNAPASGARSMVYGWRNNNIYYAFSSSVSSTQFKLPSDFLQEVTTGVRDEIGNGPYDWRRVLLTRSTNVPTTASPGSRTVDYTAMLAAPSKVVVAVDGSGRYAVSYDAGTIACGSLVSPALDAVVAAIHATTATTSVHWMVAAPPSANPVVMPELAPSLTDSLWPVSEFTATEGAVRLLIDEVASTNDMLLGSASDRWRYPSPDSTFCFSQTGSLWPF